MGQQHKHKDLIIAWANGAEIEQKGTYTEWSDFLGFWFESDALEYRIKPEPKPDVAEKNFSPKISLEISIKELEGIPSELIEQLSLALKKKLQSAAIDGETSTLKMQR